MRPRLKRSQVSMSFVEEYRAPAGSDHTGFRDLWIGHGHRSLPSERLVRGEVRLVGGVPERGRLRHGHAERLRDRCVVVRFPARVAVPRDVSIVLAEYLAEHGEGVVRIEEALPRLG